MLSTRGGCEMKEPDMPTSVQVDVGGNTIDYEVSDLIEQAEQDPEWATGISEIDDGEYRYGLCWKVTLEKLGPLD